MQISCPLTGAVVKNCQIKNSINLPFDQSEIMFMDHSEYYVSSDVIQFSFIHFLFESIENALPVGVMWAQVMFVCGNS